MSTIAVWKVTPDRPTQLNVVAFNPAVQTLDQASRQIPGGAYTTFRTYSTNQAHHFKAHLDRLAESSRQVKPYLTLDVESIRQVVRQALAAGGPGDHRLRLTIDLECEPGTLYITCEPLKTPSAGLYQTGVETLVRRLDRQTPKAKLTAFILVADQVRDALANGIHEILMLDEDRFIQEGLSSNFFAVIAGEIWTADEAVLSGITRSIVLEEAAQAGIQVHLKPVHVDELERLEEAFITSSSRGVLPVTRIEGQPVGAGRPGPVTRLLMERYDRRIQGEIEPV